MQHSVWHGALAWVRSSKTAHLCYFLNIYVYFSSAFEFIFFSVCLLVHQHHYNCPITYVHNATSLFELGKKVVRHTYIVRDGKSIQDPSDQCDHRTECTSGSSDFAVAYMYFIWIIYIAIPSTGFETFFSFAFVMIVPCYILIFFKPNVIQKKI